MSGDVYLKKDFLLEEDFNLIREWVSNKKMQESIRKHIS